MYELTCPSCKKPQTVKYSRIGATAKCVSCGNVFRVDEGTVRQLAPVEELKPLSTPLPSVEHEVSDTTPPPLNPPHPGGGKRFPLQILLTLLLLGAVVIVFVIVLREQGDPLNQSSPTREVALPEPPPATIVDEDILLTERVLLTPVTGASEPIPDAVVLEAVPSRIGVAEDETGGVVFTIAVRNPGERAAYNPRIDVVVKDENGEVLRSWRCDLSVTLAPSRVLEFEALLGNEAGGFVPGRIEVHGEAFPGRVSR